MGGFWNDFFEIFGQNAKKAIGGFIKTFPPIAKNAKNLPKQDLDHKCAKSGWAAVLPRGGISIQKDYFEGSGEAEHPQVNKVILGSAPPW